MKRRKWISLLLSGALILTTLPTTALAEGTEMDANAGVQVESVSEEVLVEEQTEEVVVEETLEENEEEMPEETPAEAPETNPKPGSEETPEEIVEIKEEETVEEAPEEEIFEENPENTIEEVPAETEQENIPAEEENLNPEETAALAANNETTTLESPGIAVQAGTSVTYYDENGVEHTAACNDVITQANIENYETLPTGWYAVEGTVTGDTRIKVQGTVNLILEDGCSFTVNGGIEVNEGNALTIWGQQKGNGELKTQNVRVYCAGIGGGDMRSGGNITVAGGSIIANGGLCGAGIGGGSGGSCGTITITGCSVYAATSMDFAIGAFLDDGSGSLSITNSIVVANGRINESNKGKWSGIIFENSETYGIVYGNPTLSQEFTLKTTQNVLIPENTSLQGAANLKNDGNIYVSGTLAESVSGSGKVHYALTVTGGTAQGDVSTYKDQLYGKTGGSVTLNATNVPVGQAASWSCSDDTVTIANDTFTMPAKKLTITAQYTNAPSYTVTIPATVELGNTAEIQAEDVNVVSGSQLVVRLSDANGLKLTTPEGAEQLYTIKNGETSIQENDAVLTVVGGTADNRGTVSLNFAPDGETKYAGVYTGTVMFNVSVETASTP